MNAAVKGHHGASFALMTRVTFFAVMLKPPRSGGIQHP
jgi:hypothetical protein